MSTDPKFDLGGFTLKEWAFIVLMIGVIFVIAVVSISFAIAVSNDTSGLILTGSFDISQFVAIIIGIAMVATVLVSQQLTSKTLASAMKK